MQLITFTSSRPGALIEQNCYKSLKEVLRYKDMQLSILRDKHNEDGTIVMDSKYQRTVPGYLERVDIRWKPETLEIPIFQDVTSRPNNNVSGHDAWSFASFNHYLKRLDEITGFPEVLTSYALRRGAGNALDCPQVTEAQRNQLMGHERAKTFQKYYISQKVKVDSQSLFLGTVSRDDLFETIGQMGSRRNPLAPKTVPPHIMNELLEKDSSLVSMNARKSDLHNALNAEYVTLTKAGDDDRKNEYDKLTRKIRTRKKSLERKALKDYRAKFFYDAPSIEMARQKRGEAPSTLEPTPPINFVQPTRTQVAQYFASNTDSKTDDSKTQYSTWFDAVRRLRNLCLQGPLIHKVNCHETGKVLCSLPLSSSKALCFPSRLYISIVSD
ncbi:hypothetical protein BZA77DRAFT_291771 [Pyronema omphalodes]|nr:hypothetical protein BZA77DRAFT_291771 [Pyronema omphalodes]